MPHPNNKEDKNINPMISRQDYHTQPCSLRGVKKNLTSCHQNVCTSHPLHEAYTNHWTNLTRAETKRKKEFNLKAWVINNQEGRRRRGWQRMRWLDGITDSIDMSLTSSGSWCWTEKPDGVANSWTWLSDWTELNWSESPNGSQKKQCTYRYLVKFITCFTDIREVYHTIYK